MSKMRVVMFAVALGCAIMAGLLAKGVLGNKKQQEEKVVEVNTVKTTEVLVVAKDVHMGEKLGEGTLAWKVWPVDNVLPTMITKEAKPDALTEMTKTRARIAMYEGEMVMEKKLLIAGQGGFMGAMLQKGMRAISVAVSSHSTAGGFILPDDRVDVILTKKDNSSGVTVVKSELVLSNVRVLAINQVYNQGAEGDAVTVENGQTATLELTPKQSEVITLVESSGELQLALRSIAENDGKKLEDVKPELEGRYAGKSQSRGTDTLFVRAGVETYSANQ
jgi:pilus assembly protein CpaB